MSGRVLILTRHITDVMYRYGNLLYKCILVYYLHEICSTSRFQYGKELKYFFALIIGTAIVCVVGNVRIFERADFKLVAKKRILLPFVKN